MEPTPVGQQRASYGHYDVELVLGQGAMGTVYLARDRRIGRRVALKTIQFTPQQLEDSVGDAQFFARLQREAELCGSLNHPNLVTLYEAGYENGLISYLAIEYVEGESLQTLLKRQSPLSVVYALHITEQVLEGLAYAHSRGVIHRDIKPGNILLSAEGRVKIADFGIARPSSSNLTRAGMLMGTPNYMAPEQVKGEPLSPRSDLFSVGVMLFQMLTGSKPFAGPDVSGILYKIVHEPTPSIPTLQPSVPAPVVALVERLMEKDPANRYGSASEALQELQRIRLEFTPTTPVSRTAPILKSPDQTERDLTRLDRTVPTRVFWSVAAALASGALLWIFLVAQRVDPSPTVEISQQKLREFDEKKRMIDAAEALYRAGSYEESARQYEEYLKRFPNSPAAEEGLQRARDAQREFEIMQQSKGAAPKSPAKKKKEEDWLLQKLKKIIRDR